MNSQNCETSMTNPTSPSDDNPVLDPGRIIGTLDRHNVDYILVGGLGAAAHGATRPTYDFDALTSRTDDNLDRVAAALTELGGFYRVDGLTDDEARALPTVIDRHTLRNATISTWRTDAGDVDILTEMPGVDGQPHTYADLHATAIDGRLRGEAVRVAALDDIIASKRYANRSKDQQALPELNRLARRQHIDNDIDENGLGLE